MAKKRLRNNLRLMRFLKNEMTQAELGERIGVTRQTIAAIEAGKYSPTLETAFRLAEVPGVAVVPERADGEKCERCWKVLPEVGHRKDHSTLCGRCADAVAGLETAA